MVPLDLQQRKIIFHCELELPRPGQGAKSTEIGEPDSVNVITINGSANHCDIAGENPCQAKRNWRIR
jgi:hypothetical protein